MRALSVVVPVLDDRAAAERLFGLIPAGGGIELIVVDGGHDVQLEQRVAMIDGRGLSARYIRTLPGRARQMNAGAAAATGDWLLFLHADSEMPDEWFDVLATHTHPVSRNGLTPFLGVGGGWFQFAIADPAWQARVIEWGVRLRVRLLSLPYGDQGIFVRRDMFTQLGGFRDMALMEDVDFVRRLVKETRVVELPVPIKTSPRRWRAGGWFRRSGRNLALLTLYYFGVPPARLARWYG